MNTAQKGATSQVLFIPGPLPGMNDYIGKGSRWPYNNGKKQWTAAIAAHIKAQKLKPMTFVRFHFIWQEKNQRRDPDNFTSIGKKFIFDALVQCGILPDDGWENIAGWEDSWLVVADRPGVYVFMDDVAVQAKVKNGKGGGCYANKRDT